MPHTWHTKEVQSIDAHEYVRQKIQKTVSAVQEKVVVPVAPGLFTRADVEAGYRYYRESP